MKKFVLIIGIMLMILCGSGVCTIDRWKTNDALTAQVSGGDDLAAYADVTKVIGIDESGVYKVYDAKLTATDVKDITMRSSTSLILFDENGREYTANLEIADQLTLPKESNVVMNHDGEIQVDAINPSKPKTQWRTSLEFPDDVDLNDLGLGSFLEQMSDSDLETLSTYCEDNGVGYSAGAITRFSESNDDVGIKCEWGEGERISIGG
jgi:hypothetical protein